MFKDSDRVLTYCTRDDCNASVQTDGDQVPTDQDTFYGLCVNLTETPDDRTPDHVHLLGHEIA